MVISKRAGTSRYISSRELFTPEMSYSCNVTDQTEESYNTILVKEYISVYITIEKEKKLR